LRAENKCKNKEKEKKFFEKGELRREKENGKEEHKPK
jgi:hypothetical protein